MKHLLILFLCLGLPATASASDSKPIPIIANFDHWVGDWRGTDKALLTISPPKDGIYTLTLKRGDTSATYEAVAGEKGLQLIRDGKTEWLSDGKPAAKELAKMKNCLVISESEGYCRH